MAIVAGDRGAGDALFVSAGGPDDVGGALDDGVAGLAGEAETGGEIGGSYEEVNIRHRCELVEAVHRVDGFDLRHETEVSVEQALFADDGRVLVVGDALVDGARDGGEAAAAFGGETGVLAQLVHLLGRSIMGTSRMSGPHAAALRTFSRRASAMRIMVSMPEPAAIRQRSAASAKVMWPCSISI